MPSKNTSRKNTKQVKQVEKPKAETTNENDEWSVNIVVKSAPNSRGSTRSNKSGGEKEPAPTPTIPDWEKVGMTENDYKSMLERVAKEMANWQIENMKASLDADWDSIQYWEHRLEMLERSRETYNKKWGWSAEDIYAVEVIDADIAECEKHIERIEEMDSFEEWDFTQDTPSHDGVLYY